MMSMKNKTQQSVKRSVPTWKAIRKFTSSLSLSQMTFRLGWSSVSRTPNFESVFLLVMQNVWSIGNPRRYLHILLHDTIHAEETFPTARSSAYFLRGEQKRDGRIRKGMQQKTPDANQAFPLLQTIQYTKLICAVRKTAMKKHHQRANRKNTVFFRRRGQDRIKKEFHLPDAQGMIKYLCCTGQ
jgi:hypothetical protein